MGDGEGGMSPTLKVKGKISYPLLFSEPWWKQANVWFHSLKYSWFNETNSTMLETGIQWNTIVQNASDYMKNRLAPNFLRTLSKPRIHCFQGFVVQAFSSSVQACVSSNFCAAVDALATTSELPWGSCFTNHSDNKKEVACMIVWITNSGLMVPIQRFNSILEIIWFLPVISDQ